MIPSGDSMTCTFDTAFLGDDAQTINHVIQVVAQANKGQLAVDKNISVISTPDLQPQFSVEQLVDANGDGIFGDEEEATIPLKNMTFQVRLTNLGLEQLTMTQLHDYQGLTIWSNGESLSPSLSLSSSQCTGSILDIESGLLGAGQSVVCLYSMESPLKDASRFLYTTTVVLRDDDNNQIVPEASAIVGTADQKPKIEIWQPELEEELEMPGPNSEIACRVRVTNVNLYEPVTLIRLQQEVQVTPEEGSLTVLQAEQSNIACRMPKTIGAGGFYECTYSRFVEAEGGERIACLVTVLAEDDDGNQTSIAQTTNIYTFMSPTGLPVVSEPVLDAPVLDAPVLDTPVTGDEVSETDANETYVIFIPFIELPVK